MFGPKTEKRIMTATRQVEQNPRYASYLNETLQQFGAVLQDTNDTIGVTVGSEGSPGANGTHVYDGTWKVYDYAADEWVTVDDTDTACKVIDINGNELQFGRRYIALRCAYSEADNIYYFMVDNGVGGTSDYTPANVVTKLCITREYNDEDPPVLLCVTDITYEMRSLLVPTELLGDVVCGPYEDLNCCDEAVSNPMEGVISDPDDLVGCSLDDMIVELPLVSSNLLATRWEGPVAICSCTAIMSVEFRHNMGETTGILELTIWGDICYTTASAIIDPFTWDGVSAINETFTGVMVTLSGTSYGPISVQVTTV